MITRSTTTDPDLSRDARYNVCYIDDFAQIIHFALWQLVTRVDYDQPYCAFAKGIKVSLEKFAGRVPASTTIIHFWLFTNGSYSGSGIVASERPANGECACANSFKFLQPHYSSSLLTKEEEGITCHSNGNVKHTYETFVTPHITEKTPAVLRIDRSTRIARWN